MLTSKQLVTFPTAHYAVRPIRRLHEATKLCGRPPEYREEPKRRPWWSPFGIFQQRGEGADISDALSHNSSGRRDNFRIPQKVPMNKHIVTDELTALITTFNVMTEELLEQYEKLEEKVHQRTEELQQQTVLAESANEAKTMFIANVSHELRTPLNGILGMCSLVLEESSLPLAGKENLEVVFKSGQLLLHLLNDLITFSKNQVWGAQVKLEISPFRVREFVSQIAALFGAQARDKSIELTYEVVPRDGIDFVLIGDINRILQVIINLISNSLKFTDEGGSVQLMIVMESLPNAGSVDITPYSDVTETHEDYLSAPIFFKDSPANSPGSAPISPESSSPPLSPSSPSSPSSRPTRPPLFTRRSTTSGANNTESDITKTFLTRSKKFLNPGSAAQVPRSSTTSPSGNGAATHYVEFRVIDTGPGVPESMQKKIFEPFVQADVGLSRKYGGTGLGLSICQQLAKLMGGDIHLKSFEGAGSTFSLRIPLHLATQSLTLAASSDYPRPLSASRKSAHTATRSLSAFSGAAFSGRSGHDSVHTGAQDGNLRLVGLSQPFFVPSRAESENDFPLADAPPPPHNDTDPQHPMTPVTEVDTPSCSLIGPQSRKFEFSIAGDGPSDTRKKLEEDLQAEGQGDAVVIRVLVAEDNKINQKLVVKVLQLEGVNEVTVAEDGREAVDRVKEVMDQSREFDIIFMDIQVRNPPSNSFPIWCTNNTKMPNVDGHEATRQIRAMGYKAPIIALTAFAEESNIKDCFEIGMDCFLSKPIKRPQIRQMIETYCPGKGRPGKSSA
jgi:osomolarity two-component system sensor histidine kinase SLN1